jgi:hypothetical protein
MHPGLFKSLADLLSLKLKRNTKVRGWGTYACRNDVFTVVDTA